MIVFVLVTFPVVMFFIMMMSMMEVFRPAWARVATIVKPKR